MSAYPPPRATSAASGSSSERSRDTYERSVFAAPGGGDAPPQHLGQIFRGHHPARSHQQQRQHRARLRAAQPKLPAVPDRPHRPKNAKLKHHNPHAPGAPHPGTTRIVSHRHQRWQPAQTSPHTHKSGKVSCTREPIAARRSPFSASPGQSPSRSRPARITAATCALGRCLLTTERDGALSETLRALSCGRAHPGDPHGDGRSSAGFPIADSRRRW